MRIAATPISFRANKMSTIQAKYVDKKLSDAKNVDIVCHDMTDRDAANSALSMWEYLNNKGVNARVIISQEEPETLGLRTYDFNYILANDDNELKKVQPDIVFCVDFSASERVLPNVLEHIKKTPSIMGFDHHTDADIPSKSFLQVEKTLSEEEVVSSEADFYSDITAKSATSVIYRFFVALGEEVDTQRAYDLFSGLVDDIVKRNLVKCDGINGIIEPQAKLIEDKNAYEIFCKLKEKLTEEQILSIAKKIDVLSCLTPEQQAFKNSLYSKLNFSENGKIAYIAIAPDDEEWKALGGDNAVTSRILNNFRQEVLQKNDDVEIAIAFYEANGNYRLSAHAKEPILLQFFKYIEENKISKFSKNSGGHPTRGGGGINSNEPKICSNWVHDIVSCDDFFME